ncbi:MAG TPA: SpoIVB peptidase [Syntrophomonas sp.]|nr:SpoIVB peptidase [Syntrophomonas sp.]
MRKYRPLAGIIVAVLLLSACLSPQARTVLSLPENQKIVVGEANSVRIDLPEILSNQIKFKILEPSQSVFNLQPYPAVTLSQKGTVCEITAHQPGRAEIRLNLLGYIPIKSIAIEALPSKRVVVGGHSIGVLLHSRGIMVVGFAPIVKTDGTKVYPAKDQGIEIGDLIMQINGESISSEDDLARVIDSYKDQALTIKLQRGGKTVTLPVKAEFCAETNRYRIGLYVRDGVVGVGTLTFMDSDTGQFAALGHVIMDADTKQDIKVLSGQVLSASIQMIKTGKPGNPGEKIGVFDEKGEISGKILKNTSCGIYGLLNSSDSYADAPKIEVAYAHQVHTGKAQMLTVVNGNTIEKWDIQIEKVFPQRENGKGMIIKVTDPRLLSISGGIVQGMSGSPIIQDNKIIGAVTHVFLNDPTMGYGIFMDTMLSEMPSMASGEKKISTN